MRKKVWFHVRLSGKRRHETGKKLAAEQFSVLQQVLMIVCQSYLTQQFTTGGWTLLHLDPINFISTRHTFQHATSVRRGSGGLQGVEVCGEASGNNWERGKWRDGPWLENLRIPRILHWLSAQGKENAITRTLSVLSGKVWCGEWWGGSEVCALWQPAFPFSMLIDACSAF